MPGPTLLPRDLDLAVAQAAQACNSCKKQKRRCDKALPACGLCRRMRRACDYAEAPAPTTADDFAALAMKLAALENRLHGGGRPPPGSLVSASASASAAAAEAPGGVPLWMGMGGGSGFPNAVFLDLDAFRWAGVSIPKPPVDVPVDVLEALGDGNSVQEAAATYFDTIHPWWPIVSKKRMDIGIPLCDGGPDLAFLFLTMKLIVSVPGAGGAAAAAATPVYAAAKRLAALLEASGTVSLLYLQGLILTALYEYGHGVYPSAWMTVGACARYAEFLRLPVYADSSLVMGQCTTWTESEERRRVWWGVFILDRVISLGSKRRCSLEEPLDTYILPVDDLAWDEGDLSRCLQRPVTTPITEYQTPFARLAQVSMLISRALRHCRGLGHGAPRDAPEAGMDALGGLIGSLAQLGRLMDDSYASTAAPTPSSSAGTTSSSSPAAAAAAAASASAPTPHGPAFPPLAADLSPGRSECFLALLAPRCLVDSALIALYDMYACPESLHDGTHGAHGTEDDAALAAPERLMMQVQAFAGLKESALRLRDLGGDIVATCRRAAAAAAASPSSPSSSAPAAPGAEAVTARFSPLALDAIYCAMSTLHWMWKERGDPAAHAALLDVKQCLAVVDQRWRLAGEYLVVQDLNGVAVAMATQAGF